MLHPLQQRIQVLRRRVVRLLAIRGVSTVAAAVLATLICFGAIDYLLRFKDRGVLVVFAAAVLAVLGWTAYRAARRVLLLSARLGDADLALRVEACFPTVRNRLASAVEFLRQAEDDRAAGSAAMRRVAISQAVAACDGLDFAAVIDWRPALRWAAAALTVALLAVCLTMADAAAARTALARLIFPLGTADWPQRNHLILRLPAEPIVVVRGRALEVEVIDKQNAPLPPDCHIQYRLTDNQGRTRQETEPMQLLGSAMTARRENVTSPFAFRCTGGDDRDMPWISVQVVDPPEPPVVKSLHLKIIPPAYTNWPEEDREATLPKVILAGSRVQLAGKATKRLKPSSTLRLDDGRVFPLRIDADGLSFQAGAPPEIIVNKTTAYTFHLIDVDGVEGGGDESWQLHVQADATPTAVIQQPSADLFVTEKAVVEVRVRASDDLALRQVGLVLNWTDGKRAKERTYPLLSGPEKPPPSTSAALDAAAAQQQTTLEQSVELSALQLAPGMLVTCRAVATDYSGQAGQSEPRVLSVVTPEQLVEQMAARQSQLLAELRRVLQLQHEVHTQVDGLEKQLQRVAGLEQPDIDRLQAAEFSQREIARSLTGRGDGLPGQVLGLLADLRNNHLDNPDFQRRLEGMLAELARLGRDYLPVIGTELTAAVKGSLVRLQSSPRPAGRDAESQAHLARADDRIQQVIASLEALLAGMRQWEDYRRFQRDVAQLLRDQEETARNTAVLGTQTVGRDLKELTPQESADLAILAEHQLDLARRQTRLEQEMDETVAVLGQNDPLAAETLSDALAEARRLSIAADMSATGDKIRNNGLGLAPADQQKILQNLQEVLDILANNRREELTGMVKKLGEAGKDLDALRRRQEGLRRKIDEAGRAATGGAKSPAQKAELQRLALQQEELQRQTQQLSRRLERLTAEEAAKALSGAAGKMDQGRQAGQSGNAQGASQGAKQAEEALKDAAKNLRQNRFEAAAQLAMEQQARVQDAVQHLHRQEEEIAKETREFAGMERDAALGRAQIASLLELARQQELLGGETDRLAKSLDEGNVFRMALTAAVDAMGRAATHLQRRQTGRITQEAEQSAIDRLKLLLAAMEPEKPGQSSGGGGQGNQGPKKNEGGPSGGVLPLAQLKLLKLLQEDLNLRTQQLHQAEAAGKPAAELRDDYSRLSDEQNRLAESMFQLLHPQPENGDPEGGENEGKEK